MKRVLIAAALLLAGPALAEQQEQSPAEQALGQRVIVEINANLQAAAKIIELQRQLTAAQARVKELEAAAPKKD